MCYQKRNRPNSCEFRRRLCGAQLPSFIYWWCRHTRSSVKVKRDVGRIGGWGGGVESNLPSRRGWTRSYFNFNSGGGVQLYFKAYFANFRTPLQIIIAQSLSRYVHNQKLRKPRLNGLCVGLLSRRDPWKTPVRVKKIKLHWNFVRWNQHKNF